MGLTYRDMPPHHITLEGKTVHRDGLAVKVTAFAYTRSLRVGCTYITREALLRLVEMSTDYVVSDQRIIQEGVE